MTSVLVLDRAAEFYARQLRRKFPGLDVSPAPNLDALPPDLAGFDVLIAFGVSINDEMIARMRGLKWIQSLATGVDHFLRCPSLKDDVLVTSGRGIHGAPMRETVAYLMLAVARDAVRQVKDKAAHHWERRPWHLLAGQTAVVVGVGVAGIAIAELLKAFGMRTVGVTRTPRAIESFDAMIPTDRLVEAAGEADFLINVLPGSDENRALFNRDVFSAMKPTAVFINVGRGETVDEPALIAALREGRFAGAGLDVYAHPPPLPKDHPLWDMPNVFMTPHSGGFFHGYAEKILPILIENMGKYHAGRPAEMRNIVRTGMCR
jgi:phosphoglycerate dehydrogenase-like enzyme